MLLKRLKQKYQIMHGNDFGASKIVMFLLSLTTYLYDKRRGVFIVQHRTACFRFAMRMGYDIKNSIAGHRGQVQYDAPAWNFQNASDSLPLPDFG